MPKNKDKQADSELREAAEELVEVVSKEGGYSTKEFQRAFSKLASKV